MNIHDDPDLEVAAVGLRGPIRTQDALDISAKSNRIATLQLLRADRVVGFDHIRHAARLAERAMRQGRNQAKTLDVEFVRYAAGERQIRTAMDKMGIHADADLIAVAFGPKRTDALRYFQHATGYPAAAALPATLEQLANFGIPLQALDATTPERRLDLVLEAVAAVDLLKP